MSDPNTEYDVTTLIDSQPVIVTVIDPRSYTALYQNAAGAAALGNIRGKTCYQNIPKNPSVCAFCKMPEAIRTAQVQSSEVQMADGTWLLVQFSPIKKQDGTVDIVETITNITEQKQREAEHERLVESMLDREEHITALRAQVKSLGHDPIA